MNLIHLFRPLYVPMCSWFYDTFKAPKRYHHLFDTIKEVKAKHILEVGVWNGKRAVEMIREAQKYSPQVSYYGFDLFEDLGTLGYTNELSKMPPREADVLKLLSATHASVTLFKGNTLLTLKTEASRVPKVDFVFIDGGHSVETIREDWQNIQAYMHDSTVVIFDDYWRNRTDAGCKTVVDQIDRAVFDVVILPEIDIFNNSDFGRLEISFARVTKKK